MKTEETISYISIAVIVISLFFIGTELTGFATSVNDTGIVNVTIGTSAAISFTVNFIDFGIGAVTPGAIAIIDTEGSPTINGTWTPINGGLILENIGNVNVTLQLQTDKNASTFIGGSSGQALESKVTNETANDGACTGTNIFSSYVTINETLQDACATGFGFDADSDEIRIDFRLSIPDDATGSKTVEITAVGTSA